MRQWNELMPDDGVYDDEVCAGDTPLFFCTAAARERARQLLKIDEFCWKAEKDPVRRNRLYGQLIRKLDKENENPITKN